MKTDVLLLTDIFENYRNVDLETYNLDPAHYVTVPSFSLDAALKNMENLLKYSTMDLNMKICITSLKSILEVECHLYHIDIQSLITNI